MKRTVRVTSSGTGAKYTGRQKRGFQDAKGVYDLESTRRPPARPPLEAAEAALAPRAAAASAAAGRSGGRTICAFGARSSSPIRGGSASCSAEAVAGSARQMTSTRPAIRERGEEHSTIL
eukprot:scaffold117414_cov32-Tisochrysis_lutea.AAC.2